MYFVFAFNDQSSQCFVMVADLTKSFGFCSSRICVIISHSFAHAAPASDVFLPLLAPLTAHHSYGNAPQMILEEGCKYRQWFETFSCHPICAAFEFMCTKFAFIPIFGKEFGICRSAFRMKLSKTEFFIIDARLGYISLTIDNLFRTPNAVMQFLSCSLPR